MRGVVPAMPAEFKRVTLELDMFFYLGLNHILAIFVDDLHALQMCLGKKTHGVVKLVNPLEVSV